ASVFGRVTAAERAVTVGRAIEELVGDERSNAAQGLESRDELGRAPGTAGLVDREEVNAVVGGVVDPSGRALADGRAGRRVDAGEIGAHLLDVREGDCRAPDAVRLGGNEGSRDGMSGSPSIEGSGQRAVAGRDAEQGFDIGDAVIQRDEAGNLLSLAPG